VFLEGKERPRRDADPSPLLVPWSRKSGAIPLLRLWAVRPVQSLSVQEVKKPTPPELQRSTKVPEDLQLNHAKKITDERPGGTGGKA